MTSRPAPEGDRSKDRSQLSDLVDAYTTPAISASTTLNEIVERYPQTLPVLQRFGLDTCCGGALSLREAATRHGLDPVHVLDALNTRVGKKNV